MEIKFNTKITVDSALSTTSENPVQNKVVTQAINKNKVTVDSALSMTSVNPVQNKVIAAALANITPSESKSFTFWVNASNSGNQIISTDQPVFITYFENGNLKGISSTGSAEITADANSFVTVYHNNDISSLSLSGFNLDDFDTTILPSSVYILNLNGNQISNIKLNAHIETYYLTNIGLNSVDTTSYSNTQNGKFYADNNNLSTIDMSNFGFMDIKLNNNNLSSIICSTVLPYGTIISVHNNQLTEWNISTSSSTFDISNNKLSSFDFSLLDSNTVMEINLSNNEITSLDGSYLSNFMSLMSLYLSNNPFLDDQQQAENFANSLMESMIGTNIYLSSSDTYADTVKTIAESKGWIVYIE